MQLHFKGQMTIGSWHAVILVIFNLILSLALNCSCIAKSIVLSQVSGNRKNVSITSHVCHKETNRA